MNFISKVTCLVSALLVSTSIYAAEMKLAVTTSFNNSGLSDILLPEIKKDLNMDVHLLIVGTGQALKLGRAGDVDAILVHSKEAEESFIEQGYATHRREIMYNDFVFIGPSEDPANIRQSKTANDVFLRIHQTGSIFASRGDDSGTHRKELALWQIAGINHESLDASWYRELGAGMGATLNTASGMNAYLLADRASWLKFGNKGNLNLLFAGDPSLFNQYAYLPINPAKHDHVRIDLAKKLETWLVSEKAQTLIGNYQISGETLFIPNAHKQAH